MQPQELLAQLNWRYATKQFDPRRKIDPKTWAALEETLVLTPSSFGLQPWKFLVVADPEVREKLVPASWGQRQVADASHLVVFAAKSSLGEEDIESYIDRIVEVRGAPRESLASFRDMMLGSIIKGQGEDGRQDWAEKQVYIALGNFLTSAVVLGIDVCPMEGIEPGKYDKLLGFDKSGFHTVVAAAAGYRSLDDTYAGVKKVRFPKREVLIEV